jgi:hypothetical protein
VILQKRHIAILIISPLSSPAAMPATQDHQSYRGVQRNPRPGTAAYMQGKKQAAISLQRYHILCAAIQNKYTIQDIKPAATLPCKCIIFLKETMFHPSDPDMSGTCVLVTIDFSAYKEFKLHPIKDVTILDPSNERTYVCCIAELMMYESAIESDWRVREGGIMRALAEYGDFFNSISNYHSCQKTTRIPGWDSLFEELNSSGYPKKNLPCMVRSLAFTSRQNI